VTEPVAIPERRRVQDPTNFDAVSSMIEAELKK